MSSLESSPASLQGPEDPVGRPAGGDAHALPVLDDGQRTWSAGPWAAEVQRAVQALQAAGTRVLATVLDNGAAFAVLDEAALQAGVVHVPLPLFFTPEQRQHAVLSAGVDTLIAARAASAAPGASVLPWRPLDLAGQALAWARWPAPRVAYPAGTVKITYTSGTTGDPKGVCLGAEALNRVADGLVQALAPLQVQRHLSALPYAVLLENIAGLMAPRRAGATVLALPLSEIGLTGSSGFDPARFQDTLERTRPDSVILLPQMLRAWVGHLVQSGRRAPGSLKIVAVGGAAVGAPLVQAAQALGIPVCEGYGLSEGASVQTLNLPGAQRPGSAGRALPHARLRVSAEGEIEIAGSLFLGYLGDAAAAPTSGNGDASAWYPTGDLGRIDDEGYLHLTGRRKHVLITSYGRNVSPEWIETALRQDPAVLQAVVFGDGEPALSAVLWPVQAADTESATDALLQAAVDRTNAGLPDYARVVRWTRARAAYDPKSGLATANGRPQRTAIWRAHADALLTGAARPSSPETIATMSFHQTLLADTAAARQSLLSTPIIQGCLRGEVSLPSYIAFLREAYHHVRHTVPLLKAMKAALPPHHAWLQPALDEYIAEEAGHDEWILDDLRACGADAEAVRQGRPALATEVMVAYAYDTIARGNPLGFFGMVHVLEGTSVSLALMAADAIQKPLALPDAAFSYLRSHGTLDQEHTAHFALLMDDITDVRDQADIVHAARAFFKLYGDVFRSLPLPQVTTKAMPEAVAA